MKLTLLNYYRLYLKTIFWEKYKTRRIIFKYLKKQKYFTKKNLFALKLKRWNYTKTTSISYQLNVCRHTGRLKRVFNVLKINRHACRQFCNVNALPHIKKLPW